MMQSKTWLLLDVNYLGWRSWHSTGQLAYEGKPTGVIFGVLRDLFSFQNIHNTQSVAFCFDKGQSKRKEIYPEYKENRIKHQCMSPELDRARGQVKAQISQLRDEYLPRMGYKNVFYSQGYEADDCIASVLDGFPEEEDAVIVSSDKDYYQLLRRNVVVWDPNKKKAVNLKSFREQYGVPASQWMKVKAMAGCSSDGIKGIQGVGEQTAAKFIAGKLGRHTLASKRIYASAPLIRLNVELVRLPYPGVPKFRLVEDKVNTAEQKAVLKELGMKSLLRLI